MHPRSPYAKKRPDFDKLAKLYPKQLGPHVTEQSNGRVLIDFQNGDACRALTQVLLLHDFGIHAPQAADRLCPPLRRFMQVPNRLNYVLWVQDLLAASLQSGTTGTSPPTALCDVPTHSSAAIESEHRSKRQRIENDKPSGHPEGSVHILDIGTGASGIYPLLGCALDDRWTFTATDIDGESLRLAQKIVDAPENESKRLKNRILYLFRKKSDSLLPLDHAEGTGASERALLYYATMCNPPFYASTDEMKESAEAKVENPSAACTGTEIEMITQGGEVAFVTRMIRESLAPEAREKIVWLSSMLGKISSVSAVVKELQSNRIDNYALAEFVQGRTRRWAIAWSHQAYRLPDSVARNVGPSLRTHAPPSNSVFKTFEQNPLGHNPRSLLGKLAELLRGTAQVTELCGSEPAERSSDQKDEGENTERVLLDASFSVDTWSRAARRARERASKEGQSAQPVPTSTAPILCLRCESAYQGAYGTSHGEVPTQNSSERSIWSETEPERPLQPTSVFVSITWTYGHSRADFAACSNSLLRRLETLIPSVNNTQA
ncbi:Predicted DNA methylase [Ceraceosorus bombacis]|uniref:Predicted DNA methylase n=1 Tax=Ceraceosorus bombacis TaxID=401625 RepID=A0A0P1BC85_9BASI|nr:Predicted DNA methylase [Ceraceosorus bombacis]